MLSTVPLSDIQPGGAVFSFVVSLLKLSASGIGIANACCALYGPGDNFSLENSHVLPAMIRKFHEAKLYATSPVALWGTGTPRREFLHVDDLARACLFLMASYDSAEILNVGTGKDISIAELASLVARAVDYTGAIEFDASRPDGAPRKLLDVTRLTQLGWHAQTSLADGVRQTYEWYVQHHGRARK
jgi:GDP-L-fucose synthase